MAYLLSAPEFLFENGVDQSVVTCVSTTFYFSLLAQIGIMDLDDELLGKIVILGNIVKLPSILCLNWKFCNDLDL